MRIFFLFLPLLALMVGCTSKQNNASSDSNESYELVYAQRGIEWKDLLNQNCSDYYSYIYSLTCHYCNEIKGRVYEFCQGNAVFFIEYQVGIVPLNSETKDFVGVDKIEDLYILGTPTLFHIKEKKIAECFIGANQITLFFDNQNSNKN